VKPKHVYYGNFPSPCHGVPTVIVKSKNGGYVTQNCTQCGDADHVDIPALPLYFHCPVCDTPVERVKRTKSVYECRHCKIKWELHTLVPEWSSLFP